MGKEGAKSSKQLRPPAYPQVEFLQDIQGDTVMCRHCNRQIDGVIWDELTKKDVDSIKAGKPRKWVCNCTNEVKIVYQYGVD